MTRWHHCTVCHAGHLAVKDTCFHSGSARTAMQLGNNDSGHMHADAWDAGLVQAIKLLLWVWKPEHAHVVCYAACQEGKQQSAHSKKHICFASHRRTPWCFIGCRVRLPTGKAEAWRDAPIGSCIYYMSVMESRMLCRNNTSCISKHHEQQPKQHARMHVC